MLSVFLVGTLLANTLLASRPLSPESQGPRDKRYDLDRDPYMSDLNRQLNDPLEEIERLKRLLNREKRKVKKLSNEADEYHNLNSDFESFPRRKLTSGTKSGRSLGSDTDSDSPEEPQIPRGNINIADYV